MRHITLTGFYAGLPICGINRINAAKHGDLFHHAGRWINNPDLQSEICPECRKLWDEAGNDPEEHEQANQAVLSWP